MPIIQSARKRQRQAVKRTAGNRSARSRITTVRTKLTAAVESGDRAAAAQAFRQYASCLDRAVKRGAIKAGAADRRKSRAARQVGKLAAAPTNTP